jgi:photosystem II oxygen-evolving enhancer protein 1
MTYRAFVTAFCAVCLGLFSFVGGVFALPTEGLTYEDIVNTGLANNCPQLQETVRGSIALDKSKSYVLRGMCLEPNEFSVKEEGGKRSEGKFVVAKVLTRKTSSLDQIYGPLAFNADSTLTFKEEGGIDFQAITILLPGGEEVPFLFTTKGLVASTVDAATSINTSTNFTGSYRVPSYRTSNFLDPKGRGLTTGYESAVAMPANGDNSGMKKENVKRFVVGKGNMSFLVSKVDGATGEIAGIFEAIQPSDTDMGGKAAVDVKLRGLFYGRLEEA